MSTLPLDVRASYVVIIDNILAKSDLQTVTSKRIREGLQKAVDYDITPQKDAIKALIMERFDKFAAERNAIPLTNGHTQPEPPQTKPAMIAKPEPELEPKPETKSEPKPEPESESKPKTLSLSKTASKRKSESDKEDDNSSSEASLSDAPMTPPPKKKRKAEVEDDAAYAARLQAEENSRARPTRGGVVRKPPIVKKKKMTPKKKTADKIKAEDDSDMEGSGSGGERKVNRSGGFHKPLTLSAPLSALLDGESQLSRPQTVKRIWNYVKARDLQDPNDKRLIRCDDALRAVFKADKVHMFTMNKILSTQMYDPEA